MSDEIKKIKKKETVMSIILVILILIAIFIIILVVSNKDKPDISEEPLIIDENTYIRLEDVDTTDYDLLYGSVNLKKVVFANIPEILTSNFVIKEEEIINKIHDNITSNKEYIEKYNQDNNITNYSLNSKVDSTILYDYKDNILSVLYLVEDNVDYVGLNNYIINVFIDVNTNALLNNNDILEKYNITKEDVCDKVFERVVNEHDDEFKNDLKKEDILLKKDTYLETLLEKFDDYIYPYFNDETIYFKFNKNDISKLLFGEELTTIQYSTLKMN